MSQLAAIEQASAAITRILDALTSRGHNEAAFQVARAQFAASIRESWPGNATRLVSELEKVASDAGYDLSEAERRDLLDAIAVFRVAIG